MMKKLFFLLLLLSASIALQAQNISISGTVLNADDQGPIPGVTVLVKGTAAGTITDGEGKYTVSAPSNATLVFSFIGLKTQEVAVNGLSTINVSLATDQELLNEVVVIGYGTAKRKDLTAPIATINSREILKTATTSAVSSLQGTIAGVQVINKGGPGDAPEILVRGNGSMQGGKPLYVVDGMFYNDINWLSPNDIQSISILRDASSASIYGVRASGGVIMVTTKQGNLNENTVLEYDGYTGIKAASNLVKMANSEQYSIMSIEQGSPTNPDARLEPSVGLWGAASKPVTVNGVDYQIPATNTNWYNELLKTGRVMNHSLSLRGGSAKTTYHVGASYFEEEGLLKSDNLYKRVSVKSTVNFTPYKFLKVGANIIITHSNEQNEASVWEDMYTAVPITPVREANGDFAGVIQAGYLVGPVNNPVAELYYTQGNHNFNKALNLNYSTFAEVNLLSDNRLVWRTQFSHTLIDNNSRTYNPKFFVDDKLKRDVSELRKSFGQASIIHLDHTLTFTQSLGAHNIQAMAGFSTRQSDTRGIGGSASSVPGDLEEYLYFSNSTNPDPTTKSISDYGYSERGVSYFGRLMYNYKGKYLLNGTFRGDGTDKYSQTWGYFPSFGAGWVVSDENFMKSQSIINYLKLRASWGQLGNNSVPRESGARSITTGFSRSYVFNGQIIPGYQSSVFFNELVWEVLEETNAGLTFEMLHNRLSVDFDWFKKITKNAAIPTSSLMGGGTLVRNKGEILNTGIEINLGWKDRIGDLGYNINANLSTLHNEVLSLGGQPYIDGGSASHNLNRTEPGHPMYSFYGYEVIGIYQDAQEIANHIDVTVHPQVEPGFLKYKDVDGNKIINEKDRVFLGSNIPKFTYGGQINLDYKGFDFGVSFYGVNGNKLLNVLRTNRAWHADYNFELNMFENRWTGPGSTNKYPSSRGYINSWNLNPLNSFNVEDGSFFRIQNLTLGYSIKNLLPGSEKGSNIRLKLMAQNPLTFFKFHGFTPEVSGVGEAAGVYPIPTTYMIGVNITY